MKLGTEVNGMSGAVAYAEGRGGTWFCPKAAQLKATKPIREFKSFRFRFTKNLLQKFRSGALDDKKIADERPSLLEIAR
jgi:hypothetical protein